MKKKLSPAARKKELTGINLATLKRADRELRKRVKDLERNEIGIYKHLITLETRLIKLEGR